MAISIGVFLVAGGQRSEAEAQAGPAPEREVMIEDAINAGERQEALARRTVDEARLNWAIGEMGKSMAAAVRGEATDPIPDEVVDFILSRKGFGHLKDFRLGLTLISEERGQSMKHLVPGPVTPVETSRTIPYTGAGWGGVLLMFMIFAFPMLLAWWAGR